ncbi:MAG: xanthine dehydrogenase family protein subunit M [Deltaproteobacteria bacterium]|nr:xanthine dehydrogenase family protein subunit M [Deltaproteobacteria bacterium]
MSVYFQVEEYHRPQNLAQAVGILSRFGTGARVIAGGTDILSQRHGVKKIDTINHLVDISRLGLDYLKKEGDHIRIGAATTINTIGASPLFLSSPYAALSDAAGAHSTPTIRNRATVGGNLSNASPCADLALPLLVLDAIIVVAGPEGKRHISIESFFKGANYSTLNKGEVLLEIRIPLCSEKAGTAFLKLRRHHTAIDMAVVNVATSLICEKERCKAAGIALGSVAPISFRAKKAESVLAGSELSEETIQKAAVTAAEEAKPIDDVRATAAYRKKMVAILVRRSLENSMRRCRQ